MWGRQWSELSQSFCSIFLALIFSYVCLLFVSAELDGRAASPKVLNCLGASLRSVASKTKNTIREGKTGWTNLQVYVPFPVRPQPWQSPWAALQQHFQKHSEIWVTGLKLLNRGKCSVRFLADTPSWNIHGNEVQSALSWGLKWTLALKRQSLSISKTSHGYAKDVIFQYQ